MQMQQIACPVVSPYDIRESYRKQKYSRATILNEIADKGVTNKLWTNCE